MIVRDAVVDDAPGVFRLYASAAKGGTLGRDPDEYDEETVRRTLEEAIRDGVALVAVEGDRIRGEIHASRLAARRFSHVFAKLTAAVHPDTQGRGVGRRLFDELLRRIDAAEPRVTRVELMLQAGNPAALHLYASLGFVEEGRLIDRVRTKDGISVDDVMMARLRPA